MTSFRIAFTELQRVLAGRAMRLAVFCLVLVPTLYGGLYLYANHDPYDSLSRVPAALVVLDEGSTTADGTTVNAGDEIADELVDNESFDWQVVDADQADDGVRDGDYDFALTIPEDFSASLTSSSRLEPPRAQLQLTTNDANSYLSTSVADRITDAVRDAIAERVGQEAAGSFLLGLSQIRGDLAAATKSAGQLHTGLVKAQKGAAKLSSSADRLVSRARDVSDSNDRVASRARSIAGVSQQMVNDYYRVRSTLIGRMNRMNLTAGQRQYLLGPYTYLGQRLSLGNGSIQGATGSLSRLAEGADGVASGARQLSHRADDLHADLVTLRDGSATLHDGLAEGVRQVPGSDAETRARVAETIGDPVEVDNVAQTEADSYGAGLAPFFLALAAWIGGYVLFLLVRPLSTRALAANQGSLRVALGGWITPALIGVVQMGLLFAVILFAVDIVPENIPLTVGLLMLTSITFIAILHCLNAWFGVAGQFLGLVLLVLQLVTAGGTFPWQTIPEPLHWLHWALPMSYAVDGLRQLMYGGVTDIAGADAAVLLAWLVGSLLLTALAARRRRMWTPKRIRPELAL